jgi:elongation factor G
VRQVLEDGAIAGYRLQDVRVIVYDGKHHPVDSKEVAFVSAGKRAFIDAVRKARPVVLEPIVEISVSVPSSAVGDITSDLSSRRGRINNTNAQAAGMTEVTGLVPLSELDGYQSKLKSMTGGAGSFVMSFSRYDPVPPRTQEELVAAHRPESEDN